MIHLFPKKLQTALFKLGMLPVRAIRRKEEGTIPMPALSAKHVHNLRIVPDREALLALMPKGGVVAEMGVDHGDFSEKILAITQPAQLCLIDVWASNRYHDGLATLVQGKFKAQIANDSVKICRGYSTTEMAKFPDATFDWVYIDTDHSYATTAAELALCKGKVKPGGIIAGHDFVTGSWINGVRYGVVEAVHEFCIAYEWELIYLTHETDRHLSFAVRKIAQLCG